ncbi:tetratricopeptide repeat protein [Hyphococcus luteus]|uniref:tetratricopeptide repeat protein n=1 Tax=Hyphococcus luteus TaxID=2058213 RepID=UPI0013FE1FA5|nr:tetratricopeptide repeat protein [Marinicaulis flavus]
MANEDSVLREVDEALDEERQWAFFQKNGPALIVGAALLVVGVAGWQFWSHMKTQQAEEQALELSAAVDLLAEDPVAGRAALDKVAEEGGGYGALATLRQANSYAAGGERLKAVELYREVANGDAPRRLREFAQLRAALLSLNDGRDAVMSDLGGLAEEDGPYSYHAREILGVAALNEKDYESAVVAFNELALDMSAPEGVRERATEFAQLAEEAKAGVNIFGETRLEDVMSSVGADDGASAPAETTATGDAPEDAAEDSESGAAADDPDDPSHEE